MQKTTTRISRYFISAMFFSKYFTQRSEPLINLFKFAFLLLFAQPLFGAFEYKIPNDTSQVKILLQTYDVGSVIYSRFGHNALRIVDGEQHLDIVFNWGTFDPSDPFTFALNFYQNKMSYALGIFQYTDTIQEYSQAERSLWEDELNLSPDQKFKLLKLMSENSKPENRSYQYKYFDDNCSTRIRDYLDAVLDGAISKAFKGHDFGKTYRDIIEQAYTTNPFISMTLDIMMNYHIDKRLDIWDSMFLPLEARKNFLSIKLENGPLLINSRRVLEFQEIEPSLLNGYGYIQVYFYCLLTLAILVYLIGKHNAKSYRLFFFLLGLAVFPLFFYGSIAGLLIPFNWLFSSHEDLHRNANILMFMPMDIVYLLVGTTWLFRMRPSNFALGRKVRGLTILHLIAAVGLVILSVTGIIEQNLTRSITGMLLPYMICIVLVTCLDTPSCYQKMAARF